MVPNFLSTAPSGKPQSNSKSVVLFVVSCMLICIFVLCAYPSQAQTTETYNIQQSNLSAIQSSANSGCFAGDYNNSTNGVTGLGIYANGSCSGPPSAVAFQTFTIDGIGSDAARPLQPGDNFAVSAYLPNSSSIWSPNGMVGISFNDNTTYTSVGNYNTNTRAYVQITNGGNWYSTPGTSTYPSPGNAVTFTIYVTSSNTFNLNMNGTTYYDLNMLNTPGTTNRIQSFALYNYGSESGNDVTFGNALLTAANSINIGQSNTSFTLSGLITDGTAATSNIAGTSQNTLNMLGTGTVTLTQANTYTLGTNLQSGVLQLGVANAIPSTGTVTFAGGELSSGASTGYSDAMGSATLTANSTIALGTGSHQLTFADSHSNSWTSGKTLTITGWTGTAGSSGTAGQIFFGSGTGTLTSGQLAQISFSGFAAGASILSTGELVPAPGGPTITSVTSNNSAANTGYTGSTITIDGTNFASNATVTFGGTAAASVSVNGPGTVITAVVGGGASGNVVVTNPSTSLSASFSGFSYLGYITTAAGNWSAGGTWLGGGVPPSNANVTIANNTTLDQAAQVYLLTINSGSTLTGSNGSAQTLSISAGGTIDNNGTFTATSTGSVNYIGLGYVSGSSTTTFNNLTINTGAVTLNTVPTIDGNFQINGGNITAAPIYGSNSTLVYNVSAYTAYLEWTGGAGSGAGVPQNVTIGNGTSSAINFGSSANYYQLNGNLNIASGSSLSLSTNGASAGLYFAGSFTNNGTYTDNGRGTWFIGTANQTMTSTATTFSYLILNSASNLQLGNSNITIGANSSGLQLINTGGLDLEQQTLNISSGGGILLNTSGNVSVISTGGTGTLSFAGSGSITPTSGTLTTSSNVLVTLSGALSIGGATALTVNGTLQILANGSVNTNGPIYGTGSLLQYYTAATPNPYLRGAEWSGTSGAGYPYNVELSNNTTMDAGGTSFTGTAMNVANNLTIDAGSAIYMDYSGHNMTVPLTIDGNLSLTGNISESGAIGGDIIILGNWTNNGTALNYFPNSRSVDFEGPLAQSIGGSNSTAGSFGFDYLIIDNTSAVTLNTAITVANVLTLSSGLVNTTNTNSLTITSTANTAVTGGAQSPAAYVNGPLTWDIANSSGGNYIFPVGAGGNYLPFTLNGPTGTSPVVTVTAVSSAPSGSPDGTTVNALSTSEYWTATYTGTYTNGTVSLQQQTSLGSFNAIARSSSSNGSGTYSALGGAVSGDGVSGSSNTGATLGSFAFGELTSLPPTVSAVSAGSPLNSQGANTGYIGQSINITGTNFPSNATVSINGTPAFSVTYNSSTSLTAVVAVGTTSGNLEVTNPTTSGSGGASFTMLGYISQAAGDWNTSATWLGGSIGGFGSAIPAAGSTVTIDNAVTVNGTVSNAPNTITVLSGNSLTFGVSGALTVNNTLTNGGTINMTSGGTLTMASGSTLANGSSAFTGGAGTVAFPGSGTVSGTITFGAVTIAGGVDFGSSSTIGTSLTLEAGGYINTNAPTYGSSSTLIYNTGASTYGRYLEWNSASGPGYPANVTVNAGSSLNVGNGSPATAEQISGNLDVEGGFYMDFGADEMTAPVTVLGNVTIGSAGSLALSNSATVGGDLKVGGNWIRSGSNGVFNPYSRAVFFIGSQAQTISGNNTFPYLLIDNTLGGVTITSGSGNMQSVSNVLTLISGQLTTNSNLTLTSTSSSSVGIIDDFSNITYTGTISGNVTAQRYFDASLYASQHLIGTPVSNPPMSQLTPTGTAGYLQDATCTETQTDLTSPYGNLFSYKEAAGSSCEIQSWYVETNGLQALNNAQGYSYRYIGATTISLTGVPNLNASYAINTVVNGGLSSSLSNGGWATQYTLQSRPMNPGFNLISNPYPATLVIGSNSNQSVNEANFGSYVYVFETEGASQGSYIATTTVAPFQAFHVNRTSSGSGGTYTLYGVDRSLSTTQFYRQAASSQLVVTSTNPSTGLIDVTTVAFNTASTNGYDPIYDAFKLPGSLNRHTMYTVGNDGRWMAINTLPSLQDAGSIPMGFEPGVSGTYTLTFDGINSFDPTSYIMLEDLQTGTMYNVRNGAYTFTSSATDNWNRFILHFTPAATINTTAATCSAPGMINVVQPGTANWNYTLADNSNTVVSTGTLNSGSSLMVSVATGVYTLTLIDNTGYTVVKNIQVTGADAVDASFTASNTTVQQSDEVAFTGVANNATSYNWNFGDGATATGLIASHDYPQPGVYNVTFMASSATGCSSSSTKSITVTSRSTTGINNISYDNNIAIWSNDNKVYVDFAQVSQVQATVTIYNILGQQMFQDRISNNGLFAKEIDNIEAGYIVVNVKNGDSAVTRKVFIANSK